ncbi:hypothetical protein [Labilibaculum euxinus]
MELIKQHIQPCLPSFLNENSSTFDDILNNLKNNFKTDLTGLIRYLDNILNETFMPSNDVLSALHIHLEDEFNDSQKLLIAEYLLVKSFKDYQSIDNESKEPNLVLNELLNALLTKQNSLNSKCPDGASAQKKNKIWKQWIQDKKESKSLLAFYKNVNKNSLLKSKSIFNTQKNFCRLINQTFEYRPFTIVLESKYKSYNLLNATNTLNEIDNINNEIIDEVESIVLFDCERKSIMANFTFEEINKWNNEYGTIFKKYLTITFGKEPHTINSVRSKIDTIRERFKITNNTSYTILSSEIDFLLNRKEKSLISIEFIGFESSSFWDTFLLETNIRELYELRSIKLMNIYSVCLNLEIKNYIIEDLFYKNEFSELISLSTKQAILELRDEDIDVLKEALSNTLDLIINSQLKSRIIEKLINTQTIILDEAIIRNTKFVSKFKKSLDLTRSIKIKPWSELTNSGSNTFLILSYRDQGKYPNYYYPNLLELEIQGETSADAILPYFLFGHHFKWSKYYLLKKYHKYLSHPIRENHFEWTKLRNTIQTQKPELKLNIDWSLENEFSNSEQRETFKLKTKNQRARTFNSSDLFIVSDEKKLNHKVIKIDSLLLFDSEDGKVFIQNLDEIQENINIYEKIVDNKQQEVELDIIRKQFNLGDESAGRLWKILLKNIADVEGEEKLYNDLRIHFESKGLKIVSLFHFKNSWINPQSESIAPLSKRVFIELCEYLKIPKIYFVIIQRIRNASKQSSRHSTSQMNQLLKDLFNDGCFDNGKNAREIINSNLSYYKLNHPLDELGIVEDYLADNLIILTELIQPELRLLELLNIEKIEQ